MADADALLIRKLIVATLEGGDAHTDRGKAFGTRSVISFRYLAAERATGIFSGVSPAAHSLAAFRAHAEVRAVLHALDFDLRSEWPVQ
jgi:hypothetical protein